MMAWIWYMAPSEEEIQRMQEERAAQDSLRALQTEQEFERPQDIAEPEPEETRPEVGVFGHQAFTDTVYTTIETPRQRFTFSNLGGGPIQIELLNHRKYDDTNVVLVADTAKSAYNIGFLSTESLNVETNTLLFRPLHDQQHIIVGEDETAAISYALELEDGRSMTLTYTFHGDRYVTDLEIRFDGVEELISGNYYELGFLSRLRSTERNRSSETMYSAAYVYSGGVLDDINLTSPGSEEQSYTGIVQWVATKNKFFTQIIKPLDPDRTDGAIITGEVTGENDDERTHYTSVLRSRIPADGIGRYTLYTGPLDLYELRDFDREAYDMVDTGFRFLRWFSDPFVKWVVAPFFKFFGGIIPNMGLVIILFAFIVKIVLYPLTKKSFESMAAMRELQPEMKAIQEKYKDNPQAQQQATMKLFKKAKVNPLGGCLPNLLQAPVLITLWRYFQNSIEIRQQGFLWADDLSAPDVIIQLPFSIPFMGDFIAGFVLLMAASMVVQMKISGQGGAANPQMKIFQYVLPVVLFFVFNQFASGLSLYYLIYNTLSIGQQMLINKQIDHVKMMETVDKKKARQMAKEKKLEEKKKRQEKRDDN